MPDAAKACEQFKSSKNKTNGNNNMDSGSSVRVPSLVLHGSSNGGQNTGETGRSPSGSQPSSSDPQRGSEGQIQSGRDAEGSQTSQKRGDSGIPKHNGSAEQQKIIDYEGLGGNPIVYAGTKIEVPVDAGGELLSLNKLARAVAIAETSNCTKGYGVTHNNCFGIKKGNTYPCKTKGRSRMCNFATKEESFVAFKIIWAKWYRNNPPTLANANTWTGRDRAKTWLKHVKSNL